MIARDFAALEQMVHDELLYTHSSGVTDTKASWIESMKSGKVKYKSASCSEPAGEVLRRRRADRAAARRSRSTSAARPKSLRLLFLNAWTRTPQGWKFAAWQSCPQPAA